MSLNSTSRIERAILHVDDDPDMLRLVARRLGAAGYHVISTSDTTSISSVLARRNCRVVLLDIDMPSDNGLRLLREIKRFDGGVQVVILTGLVSTMTVLDSHRGGAEACFFKPINDFTPLIDALDAAFGKLDRWLASLRELAHMRRGAAEQASV